MNYIKKISTNYYNNLKALIKIKWKASFNYI